MSGHPTKWDVNSHQKRASVAITLRPLEGELTQWQVHMFLGSLLKENKTHTHKINNQGKETSAFEERAWR